MDVLFIHDISPILFEYGFIQVRYYGLLFAAAVTTTWLVIKAFYKANAYEPKLVDDLILYGLVGLILGARLVHVMFYDTMYYLSNPLEILQIWKGGLASHGAFLGVVIGVIVYHRKHREITLYQILDFAAMPTALGASYIRLGNFFNAEIVGRITDVSWAIAYKARFYHMSDSAYLYYKNALAQADSFVRSLMIKYYSMSDTKIDEMLNSGKDRELQKLISELPRHPSQFYEMFALIIASVIMFLLYKFYKERLARGVLTYLFFVLVFGPRFFIEFFKEYQTLDPGGLTMGQYLSIPVVLFGIIMIIRLQKKHSKEIKTQS